MVWHTMLIRWRSRRPEPTGGYPSEAKGKNEEDRGEAGPTKFREAKRSRHETRLACGAGAAENEIVK
jgi:hypothetical protein